MAVQPSNSGQKVNVFIRVRPLIQREKDAEETVNWYTDDKLIQQYQPGTKKLLLTAAPYAFDQIFSEAATTENVYETAVAPIVEKSLQGFNGTVLCYGQTSSGKTHTMYGSEDEPGIIFLTAQDLFRRFGDDSRSYFMKIGLVEVYNEKLTDLLDPQKKQIDIKEVNGEAVPKDLREIDVYSPEDMLDAARRVQKERRIGETRMNKESSRSHTILRIIIQSTPNDDSKDRQMTNALLNFVDLAGSEKADQSGAVGDRFREATYINKSLTTLSIVVNQLSGLPTPSYGNSNPNSSMTMMINTATGTHSAKQTSKQPFVSYRDSKLTRILQSSLSGNAYIALICNMTPASVEETHSTLRFASRAKCIKVDPTKNLGPVTASEYKSKIQDLEKQLNGKSAEADRLRKQLAAFTKFVRPNMDFCNSPAPFNAQLDRRRTMCPSMLFAHRTGILADHGPGDEFKVPKSPVRRSLMPTPAANNPLPSIPPLAGNNPPQRSLLESSFEVNENFLLDEPGPPPAKLAKVDAQTWTEFSPLTALQFPPPKSPAPHKQLDRSVRFDPSQSMIDEIKEEKSFIALERACEVEELSKKCESLQAELEELRSSNERLHSENEFLQKSFSDTKSRSQKVMSDYERLQEENLSQAEFINEIKEEVSEYKKRLEESEEALREIKNGTNEDQEWRDRYEALRAENDSVIKNLSEEKDELATRVEKLLAQLQIAEEFKTNLAEVTKLKDDLQQQVVSIGENLKATECEKIQLEADLATANESLATLNESLATTNGSLATAMESLSTANKSLATADESLGRLQQLEQQHQGLLEQHEALKTEATQLRQDNQDNRSERLKFEAEKDGLEIKYDKTLELLAVREKQLEEKSKAHDILLAELDTFKSELLKATETNELSSEDFSRKLELLKREKDDIDEALIKVQGEYASLAAKLEALSEELMTVKEDNQGLRETLKDVNGDLVDATGHLEAMQGENADLQIELSQVRTLKESSDIQVTELKSQVASSQLELEEVKVQKELAVNEAASVTSKFLTLQEELGQIKLQYDAKAQEQSEQVAKLSAEAMAAIKDRDAVFSDLEAQNEKVAKSLAELESLTKKLEEAEAQLVESGLVNASLNEELAKLKAELEVSQKEISELESIREAKNKMENQLTCLTEQINSLKNSEGDAEKLEASNMELTSEIQRTRQLLETEKEQLTSSTARVNELEERSERQCAEIADLKCQLENTSDSLATVQLEFASMKSELEASMILRESLTHQIEELESELTVLRDAASNVDELRKNNASLMMEIEQVRRDSEQTDEGVNAKLDEATKFVDELQSQVESLQVALDELKETNANMTEKLALVSSELDAAKTERDATQASMRTLESEKEELASGFESLSMKLLGLESDYEDIQGQLASSLQSNDELQSTIDSLQQKLNSASRDSTHHSEELVQQLATVSAELVSIRQQYESTTIKLQTCKEALAHSEAAHESVSEELKALRSQGSTESEQMKTENQELTQQLATVSAELVSIRQQYESTTIQLQACKDALAHSEVAHESVSEELKALRSKSSTESEQFETENQELTRQLASVSDQLVLLQQQYESTTVQLQSCQDALAHSEAAHESVSKDIEAMRSKGSIESEKLEAENQGLIQQLGSVSAELVSLQQQYESTTIQLQACKDALTNSEAAHASVLKELETLRSKSSTELELLETEIQELTQQLASVSAELVSFQQQYESTTIQLQSCKDALANSEATHQSVSKEIEALRSTGSIESKKLEAENQELTQQLASVSAELVSLQQQYESTTVQLQTCKEVLAHSEAAHESVSKELEALRSKSSTESEQLEAENKELLNQLEEASQKVVTMELELLATRKSRESLHSQLTTVQEELEAIRSAATGSTDHLSKQCEALQCENESLRAERRAHLLETERMELEHQQVTFKYTKSVDMLSQLEEELAGVKKAKDLLEAELDSAAQVAQALSELKTQCEYLETQIKKLEAEKKAHSAIIADLTREKETFAAQIQRLQLDLEDKKALKKELEETKSIVGQLEKLQPQIDELHQGIAMKTTEIEALTIKLRQSETSLEIMRTQLASESQSKVDELQLQIQTLQAQVYGEKSGSATLKKTNQQLSERQKTLQSDLEELKTRYNSLQSTAESANQKRSTLEQTVATLEARLAQAQQDRPRVSKRSTATQVGDTEDIMKELKDYHIYAARCKYQYKEAVKQLTTLKTELEECNKKNTENEKHIADFTARVVADSELIDSLQEQIRQIPETRETEVQCDIAAEVFTKARKYILFDIPEGWEDFGEIYRRLCHFKSEASALQVEKNKCKCNGKDDKTTTLGFPGSRFAQGSTRPWFQSRPSPTIAKPAASSVSQTLAAVGPAVGRPGVLGTPAAVLSAKVNSVPPNPLNTETPTQLNSSGPTQVTSARPTEVTSAPIQSAQQPVRPSTVSTIARRFEPTASAAAAAPSQATRPPTVPSGILSTRPLHSTDDAPVISNVSKSGEESTGKIKFSSCTQTTQPDVVAPASKRENGENQPPPPPTNRRRRINWDEPCRSIEELQKEMPRKRDF